MPIFLLLRNLILSERKQYQTAWSVLCEREIQFWETIRERKSWNPANMLHLYTEREKRKERNKIIVMNSENILQIMQMPHKISLISGAGNERDEDYCNATPILWEHCRSCQWSQLQSGVYIQKVLVSEIQEYNGRCPILTSLFPKFYVVHAPPPIWCCWPYGSTQMPWLGVPLCEKLQFQLAKAVAAPSWYQHVGEGQAETLSA